MRLSKNTDESSQILADLFADSSETVAFTGAGISTECGIPDFRSPGGLWTRYKPIDFQDFLANEELQVEAWRRKFAIDDSIQGAEPGRGHRALARLAQTGRCEALITQNIDGLHQVSGFPEDNIVELHGNGTYAKCLACGVRLELQQIREKFAATSRAPRCLCGGIVKSATISFGQSMPQEPMRRAHKLSRSCELFIAIGSSLVVYPAAGFPILAKEAGAKLVIVNREPTELDSAADFVLRGDIGDILAPFGEAGRLN